MAGDGDSENSKVPASGEQPAVERVESTQTQAEACEARTNLSNQAQDLLRAESSERDQSAQSKEKDSDPAKTEMNAAQGLPKLSIDFSSPSSGACSVADAQDKQGVQQKTDGEKKPESEPKADADKKPENEPKVDDENKPESELEKQPEIQSGVEKQPEIQGTPEEVKQPEVIAQQYGLQQDQPDQQDRERQQDNLPKVDADRDFYGNLDNVLQGSGQEQTQPDWDKQSNPNADPPIGDQVGSSGKTDLMDSPQQGLYDVDAKAANLTAPASVEGQSGNEQVYAEKGSGQGLAAELGSGQANAERQSGDGAGVVADKVVGDRVEGASGSGLRESGGTERAEVPGQGSAQVRSEENNGNGSLTKVEPSSAVVKSEGELEVKKEGIMAEREVQTRSLSSSEGPAASLVKAEPSESAVSKSEIKELASAAVPAAEKDAKSEPIRGDGLGEREQILSKVEPGPVKIAESSAEPAKEIVGGAEVLKKAADEIAAMASEMKVEARGLEAGREIERAQNDGDDARPKVAVETPVILPSFAPQTDVAAAAAAAAAGTVPPRALFGGLERTSVESGAKFDGFLHKQFGDLKSLGDVKAGMSDSKGDRSTRNFAFDPKYVAEKNLQEQLSRVIRRRLFAGEKRYLTGVEIALAAAITAAAIAKKRSGSSDDEVAQLAEKQLDELLSDVSDKNNKIKQNAGLYRNSTGTYKRPKHLIQPNETLVSIAEDYFGDADIAWLIADLNVGLSNEYSEDGKRIVELPSRAEIELPMPSEITEFFANRKKEHNAANLITIINDSRIDEELLNSFLGSVLGAAALSPEMEISEPVALSALKPRKQRAIESLKGLVGMGSKNSQARV